MTPQELLKKTEENLQKNLQKEQPVIDKLLKQAKDFHDKQKPEIDKLLKKAQNIYKK